MLQCPETQEQAFSLITQKDLGEPGANIVPFKLSLHARLRPRIKVSSTSCQNIVWKLPLELNSIDWPTGYSESQKLSTSDVVTVYLWKWYILLKPILFHDG